MGLGRVADDIMPGEGALKFNHNNVGIWEVEHNGRFMYKSSQLSY